MTRGEATGLGVSVAGHVLLAALIALSMILTQQPMPPKEQAVEVSFVEDVGPVTSAPEQAEAPAAAEGQEQAPTDTPSAADASIPEETAPAAELTPQPEQERAPVETAERGRPDLTRHTVPVQPRATPQPGPRPQPQQPPQRTASNQPQPQRRPPTPSQPNRQPTRPQPTQVAGNSFSAEHLRNILGGGPPRPTSGNGQSQQPAAAASSSQVRASIRSIIAAELSNPGCQRQNAPSDEARSLQVNMTVTLARDGSIASVSEPTVSGDAGLRQRYGSQMILSARRLLNCVAPFSQLASRYGEYYQPWPQGWRTFPYRFPRQ